jgi:hypothetical protein
MNWIGELRMTAGNWLKPGAFENVNRASKDTADQVKTQFKDFAPQCASATEAVKEAIPPFSELASIMLYHCAPANPDTMRAEKTYVLEWANLHGALYIVVVMTAFLWISWTLIGLLFPRPANPQLSNTLGLIFKNLDEACTKAKDAISSNESVASAHSWVQESRKAVENMMPTGRTELANELAKLLHNEKQQLIDGIVERRKNSENPPDKEEVEKIVDKLVSGQCEPLISMAETARDPAETLRILKWNLKRSVIFLAIFVTFALIAILWVDYYKGLDRVAMRNVDRELTNIKDWVVKHTLDGTLAQSEATKRNRDGRF